MLQTMYKVRTISEFRSYESTKVSPSQAHSRKLSGHIIQQLSWCVHKDLQSQVWPNFSRVIMNAEIDAQCN